MLSPTASGDYLQKRAMNGCRAALECPIFVSTVRHERNARVFMLSCSRNGESRFNQRGSSVLEDIHTSLSRPSKPMSTKSVRDLWISLWMESRGHSRGQFQPVCTKIRQTFHHAIKQMRWIRHEG